MLAIKTYMQFALNALIFITVEKNVEIKKNETLPAQYAFSL